MDFVGLKITDVWDLDDNQLIDFAFDFYEYQGWEWPDYNDTICRRICNRKTFDEIKWYNLNPNRFKKEKKELIDKINSFIESNKEYEILHKKPTITLNEYKAFYNAYKDEIEYFLKNKRRI